MAKYLWLAMAALIAAGAQGEAPPAFGVRPTNVLGSLGQHASFSFVRPGLTQTAFAFNGPASHQSFSSSIGDPHLAHRVHPGVAHALAYRNPGLGAFQGPAPAFAALPPIPYHPQAVDYQALALAYQQQLHQFQQPSHHPLYPGFVQQVQAQAIETASP